MNHNTVLLVIDVQVALAEQCYQHETIVGRIAGLVAQARESGAPVVYVQDNDVGDGPESANWQIHPALAPAAGEPIVRKPGSDAFFRTNLHEELQRLGARRLVVCGMKTDMCVDSTSRRAIALGYDVTLVADAHSTSGDELLNAEQTIAYHNALLWGFGQEDGFGNGERWIEVAAADTIAFAEPHGTAAATE